MSVNVKTLIQSKQAENTQTTQYTATNAKAVIDKFTGTNTTAANVTIGVHIVASGGTVGDDNLIVDARAIAPGETYTFPELVGQTLEPGAYISTIADTAAAITIRASGREIT